MSESDIYRRQILMYKRLYTAESDVYRRQILRYKDGPALKELTYF